jgi:hypothetical protein
MATSGSARWRGSLALSALLIFIGGPMHPGGTMAEMLANPSWLPGHALVFAGFVALAVGLVLYGRDADLPPASRRWLRLAVIGTVLQAIEMAVHTAAYVDAANLVAGRATPVLTTHLWLSILFYPVFGITMAGFLVFAWRERTLGSPWTNWMGIAGALAHGAAPPLVLLLELESARVLFPMVVLFALWTLTAAVWPPRVRATAAAHAG